MTFAGLAAICLVAIAVVVDHVHMVDLSVYRAGAHALWSGQPLYDVHPSDSLLPFTYPAFAAVMFLPLAGLSAGLAQVALTTLSVAALLRVAYLAVREVRPDALRTRALPVLAIAVLLPFALEPVQSTLSYGQVNLIVMWLVVEDVLGFGRSHSRSQGLLVGLAAGLKLVPGFFGVMYLVVGRVRAAVLAGLVFVATLVIGGFPQPSSSWRYWTDLAWEPERVGGVDYVGNQSLNGMLLRISTGPVAHLVWLVAVAAVAIGSLYSARYLWKRELLVPAVSVTAVGALLVSPISWSHHWVWLPFVAAACWQLGDRGIVWGRGMAIACLVPAVLHLVRWMPTTDTTQGPLDVVAFVVNNVYVGVGVLLVVLFTELTLRNRLDHDELIDLTDTSNAARSADVQTTAKR